jgi:hypothetical protein
VLDFLKSMAALRAAIRIQRQGFLSPRRGITQLLFYREGGDCRESRRP